MPTIDEVKQQIPEIAGLSDDDAVDVLQRVYYPDLPREKVAGALGVKLAAPPAPKTSQFGAGFRRSFADLPGLAEGVGAFAADAVGASETRDKLLAAAKASNDQEAQDHAQDAASITDAWDGKSSWPDFLANAAGYTAGQALQSIATGGLGSIGMRMIAKSGAREAAEAAAAKAIAGGATEAEAKSVAGKAAMEAVQAASAAGEEGEAAQAAGAQAAEGALMNRAGMQGAAVGAGAHNFGMELGSIYPDAVDQAQKDGQGDLSGGDLARVAGSAALAAGVDTAAEGVTAMKVLRGGEGETLTRRLLREVPLGMAREGGTEAVQTAIEHAGANQPIADEAGLKDIIDSAGVGMVGGALGGAGASLHEHEHAPTPGDEIRSQQVPEIGPLSRAANRGLQTEANVADAQAAVTPPAPQPTQEQAAALLAHANQRYAELQDKEQGQEGIAAPQFLTPQEKQERDFLKKSGGDAVALAGVYGLPPTPDATGPAEEALGQPPAGTPPAAPAAPAAPIVAQPPVAVDQPKLTGDQSLGRLESTIRKTDQTDAAIRRLEEPESVAPPAPPATVTTVHPEPKLPAPESLPRTFEPDRASPGAIFEAIDELNNRDDQTRKLYAPILNPKGEPFKTKMAAGIVAKGTSGEVVPVDGGWAVQPGRPEWEAFDKSTGTLGIPRADMPQIRGVHRGPFMNFLDARGVAHQAETVDPRTLKPSQLEFSPQKVIDAVNRGDDRSVLVSSDGHVMDGHHQWLAKLAARQPLDIIRLDAPAQALLHLGREFPSSTTAEGAAPGPNPGPNPGPETTGKGGGSLKPREPKQPKEPVHQPVAEEKPAQPPAPEAPRAEGQPPAEGAGAAGGTENGQPAGAGSAPVEPAGVVKKFGTEYSREPDVVRERDAWMKSNVAPEQLQGDEGVGHIELAPGKAAVRNAQTGLAHDGVPADQRILYRLNDGRLAYWDNPSRSILSVDPKDSRITMKSAAGETTGQGGGTTGEKAEPKPPKEPKPPAEPKPEITTATPIKVGDVRKALDGLDDETKAKFEGAAAATLAGVPHLIAKTGEVLNFTRNEATPKTVEAHTGYASPAAEREHVAGNAKAATAVMARMVEGSDANGIAESLYDGIREVTPEDLPIVLPEDSMIRLPVKVAELKKLEATLKKAGFRITDRAQENAEAERLTVTALHQPERATLGDAGQELGGKMKDRAPALPKADADAKAVDAYLAALHPKHFLDAASNVEQSFGAFMFKEALTDAVKYPAEYLSKQLARSSYAFSGMSAKGAIQEALKSERHRPTLDKLATSYAERLKKLQDTIAPAKTVQETVDALRAAYIDPETANPNKDGNELGMVSSSGVRDIIRQYAPLFGGDHEHSTDQSHRVVKKNPDVPPRLERIVRAGLKDHRHGKNVDEADFLKAFGFKGLEFGNWVNQVERQENLNLAYDSLMDLADLTGLSPKAIGLANRLGMAIGARGQKNTSAAAHFEPSSNVINLTKTQGNGTVGHEWFHGLDHNAGRLQDGGGAASPAAARRLVESLVEQLKDRWDIEGTEARLRGILKGAADMKGRNTPPKEAVFASLFDPRRPYAMPQAYHQGVTPTKFRLNAEEMDSGGGEKYWSKGEELLARGFESFLHDQAKGGSPYLVGPTRAEGYMTKQNGYKGTPYPAGDERAYVRDLYEDFLDQFDPETLALKPYTVEARVVEARGAGFAVLDQHHADMTGNSGRLHFFKTKDEAEARLKEVNGKTAFIDLERVAVGAINDRAIDFVNRIDAVMDEMGIIRWPEIQNGTMSESMFFHLRQGWWPENNAALIEYAAKAYRTEKGQIDRLKQKHAQEDFEAALGRYAAQRIADLRAEGSDSRAIYDYLVDLYNRQPNLDVQTGTSIANQAYSTPLPMGFLAGLLARVTNKDTVFDPTMGNGLLVIDANPKKVVGVELEKRRAQNLRLMQYGKVIEGDALKTTAADVRDQEADAVLANPPFGSLSKNQDIQSWDGRAFELSKIDHLIAAQALRAMADKGRAVLIVGAHKQAGAVTSADRVFLNWLYSNYNVADHFEIDGKLYSRQGASWPIRVLVIAGRNQTDTMFPTVADIGRVYEFDQLWSRFDEARARSEQVLVGAGKQRDQAGGANRVGAGVPAGDRGQAAGTGGEGGHAAGVQDGGVADGAPGGDVGANGRPGNAGGAHPGNFQPGRAGASGGAVAGGPSQPGGRRGSGGAAAGAVSGGLSDLSDDDIERLLDEAISESGKKPRTPKKEGVGTPAGDSTAKPKAQPKGPGKTILDGIPGLEGLWNDLDALMAPANDGGPEAPPPGGGKRKPKALRERDQKIAEKNGEPAAAEPTGNAFARGEADPLRLAYSPASALTPDSLQTLSAHRYSQDSLARAAQAANDESKRKPDDPNEEVTSRAAFSREMAEDQAYAKIQPLLSTIWTRLGEAIGDVGQRIKALMTSVVQRYGAALKPIVARFVRDVRGEQAIVPDRKEPIKAEAVDNDTQVVYRGRSRGDASGIFVPSKQAAALERAFDLFEAQHGEVDSFVRTELGYADDAEMHKALAGYQVDSLALALAAMKKGDGFIIGDDTGVGKGRQAAALIAWAAKHGKVPIFFSFKDDLYSAMADDLADIGRGDLKFMATNSDAEVKNRAGRVLLKNDPKQAKADVQHIIDKGELPNGAQAILTSYAQVNVPNARRTAIARLVREGKAVLIMDEAHNAAGDGSQTNEFFMSLLTGGGLFGEDEAGDTPPPEGWDFPPTIYLSATFAKRPENMPVYVRTQLRHAAGTPQELVEMFKGGGDVMQQIASEYLVESGSMVRRERSYAGVNFGYVTDEANAPRDARLVDQVTEVLRQIVYADRAMIDWMKTGEGQEAMQALVPPGSSLANVLPQNRQLDKAMFTSVVHNYIGQMLLATKVTKAVETAIGAMNKGHKPVFALQNTMEAALSDFVGNAGISDGDPIPDFGWQSILQRGVTSAQRVTFKAGTGKKADKVRVVVPLSLMPGYVAAEFKKASKLIDKFQSTLPGSPIDALRAEMGKYFVVEGADGAVSYTKTPPADAKARPLVIREITGREFGVDYSTNPPTYRRRQDPDNVDAIRGYQGVYDEKNGRVAKNLPATIDALILNSSGSTGISLHASVNATDQRPRHMIVLQPNPDIAVFKQTLGRIHRTGQVEWPFFTVLATGIPAERRLLAVLKKKIGTLFSNTSGGEGSTNVDAVDFINQYGDAITQQYLQEQEDIARFVNIDVNGEKPAEDLALKASGRASLLSVDDQQAYFDTIEERFKQEIEMRNATGTNALNRRAIDLQAELVGESMLEEGMDEENKFTASALLRKYLINVVGDIPDAEKVRAAIESALAGRDANKVVGDLEDGLRVQYDEALNQLGVRKSEIEAQIAHEGATEKEKEALKERLTALTRNIQGFAARRETTLSNLRGTYHIGAEFHKMTVGDVDSQAVVIGITPSKSTSKFGNPFAPSNVIVHFQRNVPNGRISIPLSKLEAQDASGITVGNKQSTRYGGSNIDDWFSLRNVSGGRQERYIAGGNLLRARANVKGGEVLLHTLSGSTADNPLIQSGIMMPKDFAPEVGANTEFVLRYPKAGADYVLSVLRAINLARFEAYSNDEYKEKADALAEQARFTADVPDAESLSRTTILRGPRNAWELRTFGGAVKLSIDGGGGITRKIASNKELRAIVGEMSKKRGDDQYRMENGASVSDPVKIAKLVALLGRFTPLVVPEKGVEIAKALQQKHYAADNKGAEEDAAMSRRAGDRPGESVGRRRADQINDLVSKITASWAKKPNVVVVRDMSDERIPEAVRKEDQKQKSQDAEGAPEGFYYKGTVYLVSNQLPGDADVLRVLLHESLGHYGLRNVFGRELTTVLDRLATLNAAQVRAKARQYGLDFDKLTDRRAAAEEVLAEMAQSTPEIGWVQKAIAAIRSWVRANVPGFANIKLSDEEIVRDYILPARGFVKGEGPDGGGPGGGVALSRSSDDGLVAELQRHGAEPRSTLDALRAFNDGDRIFAAHDMEDLEDGEPPAEITSAEDIRSGRYTPDQMLVLPRDAAPKDAAAFSRSVGATLSEPGRSIRDVQLPAGYLVGDLLNREGSLSWWHKTVGTPYNLAQKSRPFRRVYDSVQKFLNDVSFYAAEAADLAPRILPRLDGIRDLGKTPLSAKDRDAIARPVFEGTLNWTRDAKGNAVKMEDFERDMGVHDVHGRAHELLRRNLIDPKVLRMWQGRPLDEYEQMIAGKWEREVMQPGVVFAPSELKRLFGLDAAQVSLYQEFRKSIDRSINNLAISDMLRFGGVDVAKVRERVANMNDAKLASEVLRDHLFELAKTNPERADVLNDTANKMIDKGDRAATLIDKGYAPLSRFGQYTLDVVDKEGRRVYFSLFESPTERSKMARQMEANYPGAEIRQGATSEEEYKLFAGVSPETLALFGEFLGLEEQGDSATHRAFQEYIKLAKNNRSAMKRLIERKGIAGFSEDVGRVLAGFVYSNARQTSSNVHMGEMTQATSDIPQGSGQLKDAAVRLVDYVKNPQQEAQGLRGLLFAQYLGGSVASAMVNATQPIAVTFPYLSQWLGVAGSAKMMAGAVRDAAKKATGDVKLDAALKRAEEEGIVSPQEVHSLQAQAAGRAQLKSGDGTFMGDASAHASNAAAKAMLAWGQVFSIPEQFNRRTTFIAAYRTAIEKKIADPAAFAAKAVAETQFTYNKGNKPAWARGAFGSVLFTFKQYSVSYLELLHRMYTSSPEGKRAAMLALAVLFLMSGTDGLPGADDLDDLIDAFMQRLGYNWNTKMEKRAFFASILGDGGAQFVSKGISGLPGAPIDVSGRMSMGNLIPGTGLLTRKPDHTSDVVEILGPAGDLAKRGFQSADALARGDFGAAATGILPTALSNAAKAYDMATTGAYHDQAGRKVLDTDGYDAAAKAIGFQPNAVARVQEAAGEAARYKGLAQLRTGEIEAKWAQGIATGDQSMVDDARAARDEWNAKNPEAMMKLSMPAILKQVRAMRESKEQRVEKAAPSGMKQHIRETMKEAS